MPDAPILVIDTATKFDQRHRGAIVVCGSHGGIYPGYLAAKAGLRAVLLNDAGVGLEHAGIGCLDYCRALGMAAATVAHASARIGDGEDMRARGRISHVNPVAAALGVAPGQTVDDALARLVRARKWRATPPAYHEGRHVAPDEPGKPRLICIDSASMVEPADAGQIVVTGSHGGVLASLPELVLQVEALAALFNDAGIGIDEAGATRLPALDRRGIAAATVDAMSARIGDGLSTWRDGVISRVNRTAASLGAAPGMTAKAWVERLRPTA
jgi:uncharacterized protein YunC (DUF1805 family)